MKPVSILIANYCGYEALQLCVESILARTDYPPGYRIHVWNSPADGKDKEYLSEQAEDGNLVYYQGEQDASHGEAVAYLLQTCPTEWACILDSDSEILNPRWLTALGECMTAPDIIAVARYREGGLVGEHHEFILTHTYWLACMLLNVPLFWQAVEGGDIFSILPERLIPYEKYKYARFYARPTSPKWDGKVGIETGGGLADIICYDNKCDARVVNLPEGFFHHMVWHYGGLSRNHWRPEHPDMAPRWLEVKQHLSALRRT